MVNCESSGVTLRWYFIRNMITDNIGMSLGSINSSKIFSAVSKCRFTTLVIRCRLPFTSLSISDHLQ